MYNEKGITLPKKRQKLGGGEISNHRARAHIQKKHYFLGRQKLKLLNKSKKTIAYL